MTDASWHELEDFVARRDPDRYVASLFTSSARRHGLIALYAFNQDVARIREVVHEPLVGHIRLGWWREQVAAMYDRRPVTMPLALALHETIDTFALPRALFETYFNARAFDLSEAPFADEAALEGYSAATGGSLMQLASRVTGAEHRADIAARHAAIAFAYAGFIRSLGFDAARRFCRLPLDWLAAEGLNPEDVFAAKATPSLRNLIARLAATAATHSVRARVQKFPMAAIAALAPTVVVGPYLKGATSAQTDPFGKPVELSRTERIARIAWSALTWRI